MTDKLSDSIYIAKEDVGDWWAIKRAFRRHKKSFSAWIVKIAKREFTSGGWAEMFESMEKLEVENDRV